MLEDAGEHDAQNVTQSTGLTWFVRKTSQPTGHKIGFYLEKMIDGYKSTETDVQHVGATTMKMFVSTNAQLVVPTTLNIHVTKKTSSATFAEQST